MELVDFYPLKGAFRPGEPVRFQVQMRSGTRTAAEIRLSVCHLDQRIASCSFPVSLLPGDQSLQLEWEPPDAAPRGYGATCQLVSPADQAVAAASTAFDVLHTWTAFPRYGFLSDFWPEREDLEATLDALVRFHINGLQFYDWGYRHDCLVPPTERYTDPLGRELSLTTVRRLIAAAHARGMAAMPYLAIYAASLEFWRAHPDWALYDERGRPLTFMDFLGLMDPSPGSPWASHLQAECARVLSELPFDGLHVDQYGEPRRAFNACEVQVDLPAAFAGFIRALKEQHPQAAVVFNAVDNWPIEPLATSPQDFMYIEVWPSSPTYADLAAIVSQARRLSAGKPVVIALYLPAERAANIRLADALIYSCGGSRIELGEGLRLLADPYFPKHQPVGPALYQILRNYHDFVVRYGELLGPWALEDSTWEFDLPKGVWGIGRRGSRQAAVSLVNLRGLESGRWDEPHPEPAPVSRVPVRIAAPQTFHRAWWASPDRGEPGLRPLASRRRDGSVEVELPFLDYWALLVFELEE